MRRLIPALLALFLLCGCSDRQAPTTPTQTTPTTVPTTTVQTTEATLPPETTVPADPMDLLLDSLSLRQKVGQLFIAAPDQLLSGNVVTAMSDELAAALDVYPLGGFILFSDNIQDPEQITALNQALADTGMISPFLSVDEEGGDVARLADNSAFDLPVYESAAAVGASGDPADARAMGQTIGAYLHRYGFNLNFAPVADVNTNPDNPVIGDRAFSSDPVVAAQMADAFAAGLRENGICATYKHFPGHGDTDQDSHYGLAVSYHPQEYLDSREWVPFRTTDAQDMIMVAHVALPSITGDMTPATLSRQIVSKILREDLAFEGLIITDAMNMGAIADSYPSGEAAVAALQAGCDLVLMPADVPAAFDAVLKAVEDGTLTPEWLDATVRRILTFKQLHGILTLP